MKREYLYPLCLPPRQHGQCLGIWNTTVDRITSKLLNLLTPNFGKRISRRIGLDFMKFKAPKSVFRATLYGCCRHIVRQLKDRVGLIVPKPSNNAGLLGESIQTADLALY